MSASAAPFPEKRCTVLLVDDVSDSREMYAFFLRSAGYAVHEAGDGSDAVEIAMEFHPDVIVMDLSLPSVDGFTAISSLAANVETAAIPVVVLSGHTFPADEQRARAAGAAAFLAKPCPPDVLAATVRMVSETCDQAFATIPSADATAIATTTAPGPVPPGLPVPPAPPGPSAAPAA